MNLKIVNLPSFSKDVKRLYKKYKKLPHDLKAVQTRLQADSKAGIELGGGYYKIRVENSSVPTDKSKGFRVIYYYIDNDNNNSLYLMSIYSKSELANISDTKILTILKRNLKRNSLLP